MHGQAFTSLAFLFLPENNAKDWFIFPVFLILCFSQVMVVVLSAEY
jgi:hypothetical protein